MNDNFMIYVDRGNNMEQLRRKKWVCETHPYYIRYSGNHPVAIHGPVRVLGERIWSYRTQSTVAAKDLLQE